MDEHTLRRIVERAEAAQGSADVKRVLVDLALALVQINSETTRRANTQAALLNFDDRASRRR